jgi:hypothetical protein
LSKPSDDYPEGSPRAGCGWPHGADVPNVFLHLNAGNPQPAEADSEISEAKSTCWANFANHGDPNGEGVPPWPAFSDHQSPHPGPVPGAGSLKSTGRPEAVRSRAPRLGDIIYYIVVPRQIKNHAAQRSGPAFLPARASTAAGANAEKVGGWPEPKV